MPIPLSSKKQSYSISTFALMLSAVTCIVGSGWLFSAYYTAQLAGPGGAIWAWIIGAFVVLLLALLVSELGALIAKSGGLARYGEYSHGSLVGFLAGWANWLAIVTVIPIEAVASVSYLSGWNMNWAQSLHTITDHSVLSWQGLLFAVVLVIIFFLLNYWTLRLFVRSMIFVTIIKLAIPIITVILLFFHGFHVENFTAIDGTAMPYGWPAVLTAVSTTGIIFAFNGFQTPANLAGEVKGAGRSVMLATVGAIIFTLILYLGLQVVFIGSLDPAQLLKTGWHGLNFSSPFAQLAIAANLNVLALSLYFDAFLSPSGTALAYTGTTARMLQAMQEHGHMPKFIGVLHPKYGVARGALWVNLIICLAFLFIFRSWKGLVAIISISTAISYLIIPIAAVSLRRLLPDAPRVVKVPGLFIVGPLSFVVISLVFFWASWPKTAEVVLIISAGLVIYLYYQWRQGWPNFKKAVFSGLWYICYMLVMAILSFLGSSEFNGHNYIKAGWDDLAVVIAALVFYYWAIYTAWRTPALETLMSTKHY